MKDHENKGLESLTDTMKAANLHVARTNGEVYGAPDTGKSSRNDEGSSFLDLAGELQNLIITNLHLSAAIALSQTNRHFNACVNLHRLPFSVVLEFFQEKESLPNRSDDYACYTCLRLKPRSCFVTRQTISPRGKCGRDDHKRFCLECGLKIRKLSPGHTLRTSSEVIVYCEGCETLKKGRFCTKCCWCDGCIGVGTATVLRKGSWALPSGEAGKVILMNHCEPHI